MTFLGPQKCPQCGGCQLDTHRTFGSICFIYILLLASVSQFLTILGGQPDFLHKSRHFCNPEIGNYCIETIQTFMDKVNNFNETFQSKINVNVHLSPPLLLLLHSNWDIKTLQKPCFNITESPPINLFNGQIKYVDLYKCILLGLKEWKIPFRTFELY